tara:strand:- start:830 stop:982 length:153 start_codon:yes stop_codon:yes gene_type:complete
MLALSGVVHWNQGEEETVSIDKEHTRPEVTSEEQSDQLNDLRKLVNRNQG